MEDLVLSIVLVDASVTVRTKNLVMPLVVGLVQISCRRRDIRVPCRVLQRLELHPTIGMVRQHAVP